MSLSLGSLGASWRSWRLWHSWHWAMRAHSWRFSWRPLARITGGRLEGLLEGLLRGSMPHKVVPRPSQIEPWSLQNRAWSAPRRHFEQTLNLRRFKRATHKAFWRQKSHLGSILGSQNLPKSRPRREKMDVKKRCVFHIDFLMAQALFWKYIF